MCANAKLRPSSPRLCEMSGVKSSNPTSSAYKIDIMIPALYNGSKVLQVAQI